MILLIEAIISTIPFIMGVIFIRERPKRPPSLSAVIKGISLRLIRVCIFAVIILKILSTKSICILKKLDTYTHTFSLSLLDH